MRRGFASVERKEKLQLQTGNSSVGRELIVSTKIIEVYIKILAFQMYQEQAVLLQDRETRR